MDSVCYDARMKNVEITLPELGVLHFFGEDVTTFLQGQLTCDVTSIASGQGNIAAACDHKGRVLANFLSAQSTRRFFCTAACQYD